MLILEELFNQDYLCFSDDELNILKNLETELGVSILDNQLEEAKNIQHSFKTHCITIPFSSINKDVELIKQYFKKFDDKIHGIINWYDIINQKIYSELNETNATMLLMLLAITSQGTDILRNTIVALQIYDDIQYDLTHNKKLLQQLIKGKYGLTIRSGKEQYFTETKPQKFNALHIFNYMRDSFVRIPRAYVKNILNFLGFLFDSNLNVSRESAVTWLLQNFDYEKQELNTTGLVRFKLFNFALNLLDPTYQIIGKENMYKFMTIDTHMIRFIVPEARQEDTPEGVLQQVFANSRGLYFTLIEYMNMVKEKLRPVISLNNAQLQALAWHVAIEKYSKEKIDTKNYLQILNRILMNFNHDVGIISSEFKVIETALASMRNKKYQDIAQTANYKAQLRMMDLLPDTITKAERKVKQPRIKIPANKLQIPNQNQISLFN